MQDLLKVSSAANQSHRGGTVRCVELTTVIMGIVHIYFVSVLGITKLYVSRVNPVLQQSESPRKGGPASKDRE